MTDQNATSRNALSPQRGAFGYPSAQMDLVGPTADDDIRRAVQRYGAQAVKDAVKRATKAKRGRKPERDWPEIDLILREDARSFLEGNDPLKERSNYSIASDYATHHPGQSHASTHRRIMNKLAAKRELFMLINAQAIGEKEYPFHAYFRALRALIALDRHEVWRKLLQNAEGHLSDYTAKHGPPEPHLTMPEIEKGAMDSLVQELLHGHRRATGGHFGLAGLIKGK